MYLHPLSDKIHSTPAAASETSCRCVGSQNPSEKSLRRASFGRPVRIGGSDPEEGT
jgi:hypothetical protein